MSGMATAFAICVGVQPGFVAGQSGTLIVRVGRPDTGLMRGREILAAYSAQRGAKRGSRRVVGEVTAPYATLLTKDLRRMATSVGPIPPKHAAVTRRCRHGRPTLLQHTLLWQNKTVSTAFAAVPDAWRKSMEEVA